MAFPAAFLEELKARVSLVDLIGRRVRLAKRGREWTGLCPFHNEKTPSFSVNEAKGFFHCFGCAAHGGAIDFVMRAEGLAFPEAVERLALEAGLPLPRQSPAQAAAAGRLAGLAEALARAAEWFRNQLGLAAGKPAREYLKSRGIAPAAVGTFGLGYAPAARTALKEALQARGLPEALLLEAGLLVKPEDGAASHDKFRGRLMFPIADRRGRIVGFGGRILGEGQPKYLNSPETPLFHKGRLLYNLARAREAAQAAGTAIVAEGYMDVIALHEAGLAHAVAPLGTALTEEQIAELWRLAPEPILCLDGDAAGQRAAQRAAERVLPLLKPGHSLRFAHLPAGEDPDSLLRGRGAASLTSLLEAAEPLSAMLWRLAGGDEPQPTPERRAGLAQRCRKLADEIQDTQVREYYHSYFRERLEEFQTLRPTSPAVLRDRREAAPGGRRRLAARHGLGQGREAIASRREEALLAVPLNHLALLDELAEELARVEFVTPPLARLGRLMLDRHFAGQPLDVASLKGNLSDHAVMRAIDKLVAPGFFALVPCARPGASLDEARQGWWDARNYQQQLADQRAERHAVEAAVERSIKG
ncbi:MAG: DNA primase [Alphaproteobacteria bacterium]|nr:DNA primase [Alphaproteobacteria bacterium]